LNLCSARFFAASNMLETQEVTEAMPVILLSWDISRVNSGEVWMTILSSVMLLGRSVLAESSCILLTESVVMEESVLARAREKGIAVSVRITTLRRLCTYCGNNGYLI
jgi:hypothetical protein